MLTEYCLPMITLMTADEAMSYLIKERNNMIDIFVQFAKNQLGVEPVKEHLFHPVRKWRFDYAFPSHKIALEVEGGVHTGGRHIRPRGFLNDMEKYNTASVMGWRVLRTTPDELRTFKTIQMIKEAISYGEELQKR